VKRLLQFVLLLSSVGLWGQGANTITRTGIGAPVGSCSFIQFYVDSSNGDMYNCVAAAWHKIGGSSSSPLTTKGDLWGFSTLDARVGVGSDGQCLKADSTAPLGVSYSSCSGSATAGGSDTQIQFNDSTSLGGIPSVTYIKATPVFKVQAGTKFSLTDTADTTKVAQFDISGIATGTTRTFVFPNAGGTFLLTSRTINTTAPITGGGDLSADRTLALTSHGGTARVQLSDNTGTSGNYAKYAANGDVTDGGGVAVITTRNVNTTSPITGGGDLSADRTIACASCVTASSPGAGIAHFAGSTQAVTSSAVVQGDVTNGYVDLSSTQASVGGLKTFTTGLNAKVINNIQKADQFAGADGGAQITNCIAAVPAAGGTCDARGLQGAQTVSAAVTIPANVLVLIGAATYSGSVDPLFSLTGDAASLIGLGQGTSIIRTTSTGSGIAVKVGFQAGSYKKAIRVQKLTIDKTAGATSGSLLGIRNVTGSQFTDLTVGGGTSTTGSSANNIKAEETIISEFARIWANNATLSGMYFTDITSSAVDASNANHVYNNNVDSNVRAGIEIDNSEGTILGPNNVISDFGARGQTGVLLNGKAGRTKVFANWFETQTSSANDIKCANGASAGQNSDVRIESNLHRGGPTTELNLDYCGNVQVNHEASVTTGTFASVGANTDRAWFEMNSAGSATTYVSNSGTNTILWGDKFGDPIMGKLIMENATPLYSYNAARNTLYSMAQVTAGNALVFGDATNANIFFDTFSVFTFNGNKPISAQNIEKRQFADQKAGANAGAQIAQCISDLPATGGTCDMGGFTGAQTISSTINVCSSGKPVTLQFYRSATYTFAGTGNAFLVPESGDYCTIDGLDLNMNSAASSTNGIQIQGAWHTTITNSRIQNALAAGIKITDDGGTSRGSYLNDISNNHINGNLIGFQIESSVVNNITQTSLVNNWITANKTNMRLRGISPNGNVRATSVKGGAFDAPVFEATKSIAADNATCSVAGLCRTSATVVQAITTASHGYSVGDVVTVSGATDPTFNGTYSIVSVPNATTFTYSQTGTSGNHTGGAGTTARGGNGVELVGTVNDVLLDGSMLENSPNYGMTTETSVDNVLLWGSTTRGNTVGDYQRNATHFWDATEGNDPALFNSKLTASPSSASRASLNIPALIAPPTAAPTITCSNSGGSLAAATYFVKVTYNSSTGETTASPESSCATTGTTGSVTVTPANPFQGTGYTVYDFTTTGGEKKQQASADCRNITQSCVITVVATGAVPPATNTATLGADPTTPSPGDIWVAGSEEKHYVQAGTAGGHKYYDTGGTNYFEVTAPSSVTTSHIWTMPSAPPTVVSIAVTDSCGSNNCTISYKPAPAVLLVTADFVTAANTNLQAITGLSYTLPANLATKSKWNCDLYYNQQTAAVADAFGVQDVTVAPTQIMGGGFVQTAATTWVDTAMAATITTTTATNIVAFTPSVITTIWHARLDFFVEQPSNASTSAIQVQAKTGTAADTLTVKRDSSCLVTFQ
jgi:hypothetical protein